MWFKNLKVFILDSNFEYTEEDLNKLLATQRFQKCSAQEMTRVGFVNVLGNEEDPSLCYQVDPDNWIFRIRTEKKVLPNSVVLDEVKERVENEEITKCRKLSKKEVSEIKEIVLTNLLPKAFSIKKDTWIWVNAKDRYIVINATSDSVADNATALLRKALSSLPAHIPTFKNEICDCLTSWLVTQEAPVDFEIGEETEMCAIDGNAGIIRAKKQDLGTEEVIAHLKSGKVVTSLALSYKEDISFVIDDSFKIKRLKLSDTIMDYETDSNDKAIALATDLTMMCGTYSKFLPILFNAFGGLKEDI